MTIWKESVLSHLYLWRGGGKTVSLGRWLDDERQSDERLQICVDRRMSSSLTGTAANSCHGGA